MQYTFGAGQLYGRKSATNPTPVHFGGLQGVSVDIAYTTKELMSGYQFPVAVGRGTAKITGKAQFAQLNAQGFNDLFFGESSLTAGRTIAVVDEAHTISGNAATITHNGVITDLGVVIAANGQILARVANTPVGGGNYSCNETTGVYTFNNALEASNVKIGYTYTDSGNGQTITLTNLPIGSAPQFMAVLYGSYNSKVLTLTLNACMSSQLTLATKLEDFMIPDFSFSAFADASNTLGTLSLDE